MAIVTVRLNKEDWPQCIVTVRPKEYWPQYSSDSTVKGIRHKPQYIVTIRHRKTGHTIKWQFTIWILATVYSNSKARGILATLYSDSTPKEYWLQCIVTVELKLYAKGLYRPHYTVRGRQRNTDTSRSSAPMTDYPGGQRRHKSPSAVFTHAVQSKAHGRES